MTFDKLFKTALLAVLLAFVFVAWGMRDTSRYVYHGRGERAQDILVDTRTGRIFYLNVGNDVHDPVSVEQDPLSGAIASHWAFWPEMTKHTVNRTNVPKDLAQFQMLPLNKALDIMEIATPEEKRQFMPALVDKLQHTQMPLGELRQALERYKTLR